MLLDPAKPGKGRGASESEASASWFDLVYRCPNCGGPVNASPHDVTRTCAHCRSLLLVKGDTADVWVQPPLIREAKEVANLIIEQTVAAFEIDKRAAASEESAETLQLGYYAMRIGGVPGVVAFGAYELAKQLVHLFAPDPSDGSPNVHLSVAAFRASVEAAIRVVNLRRLLVPLFLKDGASCWVDVDEADDGTRRLSVRTMRLQDARAAYSKRRASSTSTSGSRARVWCVPKIAISAASPGSHSEGRPVI